jgi:hypothetical protein
MGIVSYPEGASTWSVSNREAQKEFAAKLHGVAVEDLVVGVHIGPEESNGVGLPEDFEGLRPFHIVDNPEDGWNDGAKYVVYFENQDGEVFKAVNADPATITALSEGPEFELAIVYK